MSRIYNPFLIPALLILSLAPESEQRLGQLASIIEATQNAVQTLRTGLDGFYNTLMEALAAPGSGASSGPAETSSHLSTKPMQSESISKENNNRLEK